ncbi:sushi domain protein, partial [Ostertagia ostertagi]
MLLEHMNVSCKDSSNFMIGSGEIVCGQRGWLSTPICRKLHCPDLEDIVSPLLNLTYIGGDKNAIGTRVEFTCRNGKRDGPARIFCKKDGNFGAKWSNPPPTCTVYNNVSLPQTASSVTT